MSTIEADLLEAGYSICHPFDTSLYNKQLEEENVDLIRLNPGRRALLIGNHKTLWPIFLKALPEEPFKDTDNPLDTYTERTFDILAKRYLQEYTIHFSHTLDSIVSMQRIAVLSGLVYQDSETHSTVHPVYGPWLAFRAVIVTNQSSETMPKPVPQPCLLSPFQKTQAQKAFAKALEISSAESLELASLSQVSRDDARTQAWINVRLACDLAPAYCYSQNQLWYHYTKDPKYLLP